MSTRVPDAIVLSIVVLMVVVTPIGFGSVPGFDTAEADPGPWLAFFQALGPWHLFLFLGCLLAGAVALRGPGLDRSLRLPVLCLMGFIALAFLQRFLPGAWILAPMASEHREAVGSPSGPVTWEPGWTTREALRHLVHLALLVAVVVAVRSRRARWAAAIAVVAVATGEAAYGLWARFLGGDSILGFPKLTGSGELTGTFINRNHFAALMEIGLPLALALLLFRRRARDRHGATRPFGVIDGALLAAAIAMATATVFTISRAAMGAMFGGMLVFLFLAYGVRRDRVARATFAVFVVLLVAVPMLIFAAYDPIARRFAHAVSDKGFWDVRLPAWSSTLDLVADQPVLGTGLGSYQTAIHAYQSPEVGDLELYYAHNDYLNLLADGGVVGLALGLLFAFACLRLALRHARGPGGQSRALGMAAVAALAGVGLHSLLEFNLQIPGVTVPLLIVVGLGMTRSREEGPERVGWWGRFLPFGALIMPLLGLWLTVGPARDALTASRARGYLAAGQPEVAAEMFEEVDDPLGRGKALAARAEATEDPEAREVLLREALGQFTQAASATPFRAEPWFRRGSIEFDRSDVEAGFRSYRAARRFSRGKGEMNRRMGVLLVVYGKLRRDDAMLAEGADAVREAGEIDPKLFSEAFDVVERYVDDLETLRRLTPDTEYGHARLVGLLLRAGRFEEAAEQQRQRERVNPSGTNALQLADILVRAGRQEEAGAPFGRYLARAGIGEGSLSAVYRTSLVGKRPGAACEFFRELVKGRAIRTAHAWYILALLHSDLGEHDEALAAIRRAIELGGRKERYLLKQRAILADR